ncbi:MAG: TonB-dependent receptor domain-containing protein [Bacteroidia bacterium]
MHKLSLITFLILVFSNESKSQNFPQGQGRGQMPDSVLNQFKSGKVFGIIRDSATNQPVEFASVALFKIKDSSVAGGTIADAKGKFTIKDLSPGRYTLKISFIGYRTFINSQIFISPKQPDLDVGIITLAESQKKLKEVNITAEKSDLINSIDRKTYNVDKNIINTGGTVTDVLQNIPSVSVDIDGKVSLRGSENITVLIDGKPSSLTGSSKQAVLQQLPASTVEKIEVITNPSAKYDAEGMAGIINIITKKEKMKGLNGQVTAGAGTNDKYNASLNLNNRTDKTNVYANYTFRHENRKNTGESMQQNFIPDTFFYSTTSFSNQQNNNHSLRTGVDFFIDNYNTLGIGGSYNNRKESRPETINYTFFDKYQNVTNAFGRNNSSEDDNETMEGTFDYRRTFFNSKKELTASGNFSSNKRDNVSEYKNVLFSTDESPYQESYTNGKFITSTFQTDYVHPFKNAKLETGIKGNFRRNDNDQQTQTFDGIIFVDDIRYTDHFIFTEQVYAAYGMFTGKYKSFDYAAGLRAENALTDGDSKTAQQTFSNDYFALFPSGTLKYTLKTTNEFQTSYSRRVNRPESRALNPFTDFSDSLNLRKGNPELKPEYIDSYELSYAKTLEKISVTSTTYYRYTSNLISRYRTLDTLTGVATVTFRNFSSSQNLGFEFILRNQLGKLGNILTSFNIFKNIIDADNVQADLQSEAVSWTARVTANLKFTKTTTFQLTGMYQAPNNNPQGTVSGFSGVDAGVKQDFWKGKASLSFNVNDIFKTRKFKIHNEGDYYILDSERRRESQVAMLTFSYRFGASESNNQRRRGNRNQPQLQNENQVEMDF